MPHLPGHQLCRIGSFVLAGAVVLGLASCPATASAAPIRQAAASTCSLDAASAASPSVLLLGESTSVRLKVRSDCPGAALPLHIALVLDASGTMQGERGKQLRASAEELIHGLLLSANPTTQVGVVSFQSLATTLCKLTNDERLVVGCVRKLGGSGGSAIDRGILEGLKVLLMGRPAPDALQPLDVLVLVTDGDNGTGCGPMQNAALQAKAAGVQLLVACIGRACDNACLRDCASNSGQVYRLDGPGQLAGRLAAPLAALTGLPLRHLTIVETLAPGMALIPDSTAPPAQVSADRRTITWTLALPNPAGIEVGYRLKPEQAGHHAVSEGAVAAYTDAQGRGGQATFPVPRVSVFRLGVGDALGPGAGVEGGRRGCLAYGGGRPAGRPYGGGAVMGGHGEDRSMGGMMRCGRVARVAILVADLATFPQPNLTVFRLGAQLLLERLSLKIPGRLSAKAAPHGY